MHIAFNNELFMFGGHNGTNNFQYEGIWKSLFSMIPYFQNVSVRMQTKK